MNFQPIIQNRLLAALSLALILASWPTNTRAATEPLFSPVPAAPTSLSIEASNYLRSVNSTNSALSGAPSPDSATNNTNTLATTNALFPASMDALDNKYILGIGDHVSFRIEEDLDDPREPLEPKPLVVTDSGEIEIPYIGRVRVEANTCKQLAQRIKTLLEKDYYNQATVILSIDQKAKTRGRIYISGAVRLPNPQEILSDEALTLSKAIMRAGGFTDFADRRHVTVTRESADGEGNKPIVVDVGEIIDKSRVAKDIALRPGDIILVPERTIRF